MELARLSNEMWRWTARHPEWTPAHHRPDAWGPDVGCVYIESPEAVVLIDPLVPGATPERERFLRALDHDLERHGGPLEIYLANPFHGRSYRAIRDRFELQGVDLNVRAHPESRDRLADPRIVPFVDGERLPGDIRVLSIDGLEAGEVALHLARERTLVIADALIGGDDGRLSVAPISWASKSEAGLDAYRRQFRGSVGRLAGLPIDTVLVSHGRPVMTAGAAAIARAIGAPAWGERPGRG